MASMWEANLTSAPQPGELGSVSGQAARADPGDTVLVEAARNGDRSAFGRLYERGGGNGENAANPRPPIKRPFSPENPSCFLNHIKSRSSQWIRNTCTCRPVI
jgi:hypothetical protein